MIQCSQNTCFLLFGLIFMYFFSHSVNDLPRNLQTQFNFCMPHEVERMQAAESEHLSLQSDPNSYYR